MPFRSKSISPGASGTHLFVSRPVTVGQLQLQRSVGPVRPPRQAGFGHQSSHVTQAAGKVHPRAALGAPPRRPARCFELVLAPGPRRGKVPPLSAGNRPHRAPTDAGHLGDLPLAQVAFRQKALDLFDDRWRNHRWLGTRLPREKKARRRNYVRRRALRIPGQSGSADTHHTRCRIMHPPAQFQGQLLAVGV